MNIYDSHPPEVLPDDDPIKPLLKDAATVELARLILPLLNSAVSQGCTALDELALFAAERLSELGVAQAIDAGLHSAVALGCCQFDELALFAAAEALAQLPQLRANDRVVTAVHSLQAA